MVVALAWPSDQVGNNRDIVTPMDNQVCSLVSLWPIVHGAFVGGCLLQTIHHRRLLRVFADIAQLNH
jgi:hypothetical protein